SAIEQLPIDRMDALSPQSRAMFADGAEQLSRERLVLGPQGFCDLAAGAGDWRATQSQRAGDVGDELSVVQIGGDLLREIGHVLDRGVPREPAPETRRELFGQPVDLGSRGVYPHRAGAARGAVRWVEQSEAHLVARVIARWASLRPTHPADGTGFLHPANRF